MADRLPDPDSNNGIGVGPKRGWTTSTPRWKVFGIIVLVKVFGIIVVLVLLHKLQFGIGAALLVLHVAVATLVVYKLRAQTWHGRRKQHEHARQTPPDR